MSGEHGVDGGRAVDDEHGVDGGSSRSTHRPEQGPPVPMSRRELRAARSGRPRGRPRAEGRTGEGGGDTATQTPAAAFRAAGARVAEARASGGTRGGLAAAAAADFSVAAAVGGVRGVVEALVPGVLFVAVFAATRDLMVSLIAAVGAAVIAVVARLLMRSSPMQAAGGLVGVAVCAVFAARTGDARNFFLPGLLINVGYALVYALSTVRFPAFTVAVKSFRFRVPRGPFPVFGLLIGPLVGEGLAWRHDPRRLRAYLIVTWLWVGMFCVRLIVQLPLFLMDSVDALGIARLVMGVPFFALTAWLSWRILRAVPQAAPVRELDHQDAAVAGGDELR